MGRFSKTLLLILITLAGVFLLTKVKVPSGSDAKPLSALLPLEKGAADNIGVYFWAGPLSNQEEGFFNTGKELVGDLGTSNIRIVMSPRSDIDYKISGNCISNFSLAGLAARADFKQILADPRFKTMMITAYDGVSWPGCGVKNYLNPSFYTPANTDKIQQEYSDFAGYLAANFPSKTFIVANWEGDNDIYCGGAYGATAAKCPGYLKALEGFTSWINARTAGIKASGASNVFSAVEFNIVRDLRSRGLPSVLYDVIPNVEADYFSYSSYESINPYYVTDIKSRFKEDVGTIRDVLSSAGKNSDNLVIGEYGFNQGDREDTKNLLTLVNQAIAETNIKYAFVWELLDEAGPFGLYDPSANLTPAGKYFCEIWNGGACGPQFAITNITEPSRNPGFWTIDSWRLELTGAKPDTPVKICAEQNGQLLGCTPANELGFDVPVTTDGSGNWALEKSWAGFDDASLVGSWKEWMEIGSVKSKAVRFKISSANLRNPGESLFIPESERIIGNASSRKSGNLNALFDSSGVSVNDKLDAEGGTLPYAWSVIRGDLPKGLNLSPDGTISGTVGISPNRRLIKEAEALNIAGFGAEVVDSSRPARRAAADIRLAGNIARAADSSSPSSGGGGLVPCGHYSGFDASGRPIPNPGFTADEARPCQLCDLLKLADRVKNFLFFYVVPSVATLLFLIAGFLVLLGGAVPSQVAKGRSIFYTTVIALLIIFGAWMITNTIIKSLAGSNDISNSWYKIECVNPSGSQAAPPSTQKYVCNSLNQCVANDNPTGEFYTDQNCGGKCAPAQTGTCTGVACASTKTGPDTLNCGPVQTSCSTSQVNQWSTQIQAAVSQTGVICSGIDSTKFVKAVMANESSGNINATNGTSYGLMQLQLTTANTPAYKSACGITVNIDANWLKNPANAQASICLSIQLMKSVVGACGCDVRQLAAGYNGGGSGACAESANCGSAAAADGGQCLACSGEPFTRRWECLWDDNKHQVCNADRELSAAGSSLAETRKYVPKVQYCYSQF